MDFDEDPDYLDLDDILAQTQPVNCKFLINIPGLSIITPCQSQEVTQGCEILLPFWMAKTLYTYSMIDVDIPKNYNSNFREILHVESDAVDLHRNGPYYYRFGKLLIELKREKGNNLDMYTEDGQRNKYRREEGEMLEERRLIAASLLTTFHYRRHKLLDYSTNAAGSKDIREVRSFESRLDNLEKRLFKLGREQVIEIAKWNTRKIELVSNNPIAARLSKRRKLEASANKTDTS